MKGNERRHLDDLDWWVRRYTALCTTRTEEVVRKAAKELNEATKRAERARQQITQLNEDANEAESEIKRLGGAALIEELRPMIEERIATLLDLYEPLKNWRLVETSEEKQSK